MTDIYGDVAKPVRHQTLTLARVGSSPAIPAMMTSQFRSERGKTRKREISRDFSRFFDSEVFRNFVDAFRGFLTRSRIRTGEMHFLI